MNSVPQVRQRNHAGATILELLVSLTIVSTVLASALHSFFDVLHRSFDQETIQRTDERAQAIRDILANELRLLGTGVPFQQDEFEIGDAGLGDAPLPLLLSSDNTHIVFRSNAQSTQTVLTSSYVPSLVNRTFSVAAVTGLEEGDTIYISNVTVGGKFGLQGVIERISGTSVTIERSFVVSPGATFPSGTILDRVQTVTFDSPEDWSGVWRDQGEGALQLAPHSTFVVDYRDAAGASLTLPLSQTTVRDRLTTLHIIVAVRAEERLETGLVYTATAEAIVALRNMIMSRQ